MIRSRSYLCLCFLFVLPTLGLAQEENKPLTEKEQAAQQQAVEILNSIAERIPSLSSSGNRIYLASKVADLLWSRDEPRARYLFDTLTKEVSMAIASLDPNDQRSFNTFGMIQQQRREIIDRLANRDPEMALSFLRATRPPERLTSRTNDYSTEASLELLVAGILAQKDPERALRLARTSLRKGVTNSLVSLLSQIAAKNPDAARTLHGEIVEKLKNQDLISNYDGANSAWNLANAFRPPQANEDIYRSLVELLASTVLSLRPDVRGNSVVQNFSNQLPHLMPQFEKFAPARVGALKQWAEQISRTMDPGSRLYQQLNEIMQKGTVDDMLAQVSKYGPEHQLQIYRQAAWKAMSGGDAVRARQIIVEFVPDGPQRRQMLEQLDNQLFWNSVNQSKLAEARQALDRVKSVEQRFRLLVALATNQINQGEKERAMSLLDEASALLEAMPEDSSKMTAKLQLAQSYSTLDSQRSVALLQSVIILSNQLVAAAAVLDGFENRYLREGEWTKHGHSNLNNLVDNIQQNLGTLAHVDAEGARSLSNQLERPEIRLMAELEIARSLLSRGGPVRIISNRALSNLPIRGH